MFTIYLKWCGFSHRNRQSWQLILANKSMNSRSYIRSKHLQIKHLIPSKGNRNFCSKLNIDLDLDELHENNSTTIVEPNDSIVQCNGNFNVTHSNNKLNINVQDLTV